VEDKNGLDVEICVKLGDDVTAAMWSCNVVGAAESGFGGAGASIGTGAGVRGAVCVGADEDAEALRC